MKKKKNKKLPRQLGASKTASKFFWRRCRVGRRLLQGEFHTHILYFVLSFAFTLFFTCIVFIKNPKKIVSFIVVISLLLVHYVVP
jgi:hypothetical protein